MTMRSWRTASTPLDGVMLHPLLRRLRSLGLPARDILVTGSAPLLLHGLRGHIADLDVVAHGSAWTRAVQLGTAEPAPYQGQGANSPVSTVKPTDAQIEILDGWFPWQFDERDLFDRAESVGGLNFMCIADTVRWKRYLAREKDLADLEVLSGRQLRIAGHRHLSAA